MQLGLSTTTIICLFLFSKPEVQLAECLGDSKNEKRTYSTTLINASTCDSSKMTSFDFFSEQIR